MDFSNIRLTAEHEWVRLENEGNKITIGITDFATGELGDIVFVELPEPGGKVTRAEPMGTIEAVKTVADLYAPVSGTVIAVNTELENDPALVNNSPYGDGWLVQIEVSNPAELDGMMTHDAYQELIGQS